MATIDTIKELLQENQDIAPESVTPESTFDSLNLDSLDVVELVCELEDKLGIELGDPSGISNLGELVAYIDSLKK